MQMSNGSTSCRHNIKKLVGVDRPVNAQYSLYTKVCFYNDSMFPTCIIGLCFCFIVTGTKYFLALTYLCFNACNET